MSAKIAARTSIAMWILASMMLMQVAHANVYNLENVTFDDGGTVSGSFDWDGVLCCANPILQNWDITVSGGNTGEFPTFEYTPATSTSNGFFDAQPPFDVAFVLQGLGNFGTVQPGDFPRERFLVLLLDRNAVPSGNIPLILTATQNFDGSNEEFVIRVNTVVSERTITGGTAVLVPEPSMIAFIGLGVLALFYSRRSGAPGSAERLRRGMG